MIRPEIHGATLLSTEEAQTLSEQMRKSSGDWWLRSPGRDNLGIAIVDGENGVVYNLGYRVSWALGVRPVLQISGFTSSDLKIGDPFEFGDHSFTVISDQYALCNDTIGDCAFRRDWEAENANDYEASDLKKFVDNWYEKALEQTRGQVDKVDKVDKEEELER